MAEPKAPRRGLWQRLTDALFEVEVVPITPPVASAAAPEPESQPELEPEPETANEVARNRFDERLGQLIEEQHEAAIGKLQFLDMERLKAAVGDRWEETAARARAIVEHVITLRLAPGDLFTPHGEDGFLLLFVDLSPFEAKLKAEAIAQDVLQRLVGEMGAGSKHWVKGLLGEMVSVGGRAGMTISSTMLDRLAAPVPSSVVESSSTRSAGNETSARVVSPTSMAEVIAAGASGCAGKTQFIDLEVIKAQFGERWPGIADKARQIAEQVIRQRLKPSDVFAPINEDSYLILFAELGEEQARLKVQAIARTIHDRLLGELSVGDRHRVKAFVAPVFDLAGSGAADGLNGLLQAIEATGDVAPPPSVSGTDAETRNRTGEVGVTYVPAWAVRRRSVSVFYTRALRLDSENRLFVGPAAYPRHDPPVEFEIDRAVLGSALADIRRQQVHGRGGKTEGRNTESGNPALVVASLRLISLLGLSAGQLIDLCRFATPEIRRLLVVEITLAANLAALGRLGEAINAIQPFCRAIAVRVPPTFTAFDLLARHKVMSVAVDLEDPANGPPNLGLLSALAKGSHTHRIAAVLLGVPGSDTLRLAVDAGFDLLAGPAIAQETAHPTAPYAHVPVAAPESG